VFSCKGKPKCAKLLITLPVIILVAVVSIRLLKTQSLSEKYRFASHNIASSYLAWEEFYKKYGEFPKNFQQVLDKKIGAGKMFTDPFSPSNDYLKVLVNAENIYIYSVGPDRVDDSLSKIIIDTDWDLTGDYCLVVRDQQTQKIVPKSLRKNSFRGEFQ